jgi:hypothetical protein
MPAYEKYHSRRYTLTYARGNVRHRLYTFQARSHTVAYAGIRRGGKFFLSMFKNFVRIGRMLYTISILEAHAEYARGTPDVYGTHTLAFQRIFVRMKIISLIFIRFSYVSLIRNSVTGP